MRVTVRLFARLRDIAGAAELSREAAPGATIGSVWRDLVGEFPDARRIRAVDLDGGERRLRANEPRARRRRRGGISAARFRRINNSCVARPFPGRVAGLKGPRYKRIFMFDKLAAIERQYEELVATLGSAQVQSDPAEYRKQAKLLSEIEPLVERFREYKKVAREIAQTEELASEPRDAGARPAGPEGPDHPTRRARQRAEDSPRPERPQRREEHRPRNPRRHGRRRGRAVRRPTCSACTASSRSARGGGSS